MAITVGSQLKPDRSPEARELSLALDKYIRKITTLEGKTQYTTDPGCRVFIHAGSDTPATGTDDSPGQDMCFVVDTYANDIYFISGWSSSASFTSTKILD